MLRAASCIAFFHICNNLGDGYFEAIIILILQMRKPRFREVKGHIGVSSEAKTQTQVCLAAKLLRL